MVCNQFYLRSQIREKSAETFQQPVTAIKSRIRIFNKLTTFVPKFGKSIMAFSLAVAWILIFAHLANVLTLVGGQQPNGGLFSVELIPRKQSIKSTTFRFNASNYSELPEVKSTSFQENAQDNFASFETNGQKYAIHTCCR